MMVVSFLWKRPWFTKLHGLVSHFLFSTLPLRWMLPCHPSVVWVPLHFKLRIPGLLSVLVPVSRVPEGWGTVLCWFSSLRTEPADLSLITYFFLLHTSPSNLTGAILKRWGDPLYTPQDPDLLPKAAILSVASVRPHLVPAGMAAHPRVGCRATLRSTDCLGVSLQSHIKVIICLHLEVIWGPCRPSRWSQSVKKPQVIFPEWVASDGSHWRDG